MNAHTRDALVTGFEGQIEALSLPDPQDRHVLAAAIKARANVIVTANLKDFPRDALEGWGLEAQHPDELLSRMLIASPRHFLLAVRTVRGRLRRPPRSVDEYLETLRVHGLARLVAELSLFAHLI